MTIKALPQIWTAPMSGSLVTGGRVKIGQFLRRSVAFPRMVVDKVASSLSFLALGLSHLHRSSEWGAGFDSIFSVEENIAFGQVTVLIHLRFLSVFRCCFTASSPSPFTTCAVVCHFIHFLSCKRTHSPSGLAATARG